MEQDEGVGAEASFESYVAARGDALTRLAFLMVRDHHLAQDLTQEALAQLHRHWGRVENLENLDGYVRRIMLNRLLSWRRRRSWSERVSESTGSELTVGDTTDLGAERDAMWVLLGSLPTQQRAVIVLRYYEDLDDNAIAELIGCSPTTVRSHASKAITRLRSAVVEPDLTRRTR